MDIQYLLWLQDLRDSLPEVVQTILELAGSTTALKVAMLVPCIVYWCVSRQCGVLALLSYSGSSLFNQLLKNTVCCYRPWVRDARVVPAKGAIEGASGYSFPSGHTQSTSSVFGAIGWGLRHERRWPLVLAIVCTAFVAFSRNILGVHTPQDVLVGAAEGFAFVFLAEKLLVWVEEEEGRDLRVVVVGLVVLVAYLAYVTLKPYPHDYQDGVLLVDPKEMLYNCYEIAGVFLGILLGWFIERRWVCFSTESVSLRTGVVRLLIGVVLVVLMAVPVGHALVAMLGGYWGQLVRYALIFIMAVAGVPWVFTKLEERQ